MNRSINRRPYFFLISTVLLGSFLFGKTLWSNEQFAFRDGAHFYYPLLQYIRNEWCCGRIPLWMPYENLGQPLAANPVCGVFYPGQLFFLLPFDFTSLYHWYIVLHVFLAACTMYRLARDWNLSETAGTFAALSYAFGGSVLYQHLNLVFLIGAAWFPEALRLANRLRSEFQYGTNASDREFLPGISNLWVRLIKRSGSTKAARSSCCQPMRGGKTGIKLGVVLAMIVLGGDIQAAYHVGLLCLFLVPVRRLVVPVLIGILLAAIQILPAWELAGLSDRAATDVPRSVWGIPSAKNVDAVKEGLLCRNLDDRGHARNTYLFSVPPWRFAEFIWPNCGGKQFPRNTRWFSASSWDDYVWIPSLYCGVITILLACQGMKRKRNENAGFRTVSTENGATKSPSDNDSNNAASNNTVSTIASPSGIVPLKHRLFLKVVFWISLLGSLGIFGIGWFVNVVWYQGDSFGASPSGMGNPVGGVYWLINLLLPGYAHFRYPAKLLTVASIPLSLFAGFGLDSVLDTINRNTGRFRLSSGLGLCTLGIMIVSLGITVLLASTSLWERLVATSPDNMMFGPLVRSAAKGQLYLSLFQTSAVLVLFFLTLLLVARKYPQTAGIILVVLLGCDLVAANRWMIATVDRAEFQKHSPLVEIVDKNVSPFPPRIYRNTVWYPRSFREHSNANRLEQSVQFDRISLWPQYTFENRIAVVDYNGTLVLRDYARRLADVRASARTFESKLSKLGVEFMVFPPAKRLQQSQATKIYVDSVHDVALWKLNSTHSRIWAEPDLPIPCSILEFVPGKVVFETELMEPKTVVLAEQYYPGWSATITSLDAAAETPKSKAAKVFPVDSVFQGIAVPSGKNRIKLEYRPFSFRLGALLSGIGLLGCAAGFIYAPKTKNMRSSAKY